MTTPVSLVPLHVTPPTPTNFVEVALTDMNTTLTTVGYAPEVDWDTASIDARLYSRTGQENGQMVGSEPIAAVCLRLHQATRDRMEWVVEFPARTPEEWEMPDRETSTRRLAILGPATPDQPPHPQDLALVEYLIRRTQQETDT